MTAGDEPPSAEALKLQVGLMRLALVASLVVIVWPLLPLPASFRPPSDALLIPLVFSPLLLCDVWILWRTRGSTIASGIAFAAGFAPLASLFFAVVSVLAVRDHQNTLTTAYISLMAATHVLLATVAVRLFLAHVSRPRPRRVVLGGSLVPVLYFGLLAMLPILLAPRNGEGMDVTSAIGSLRTINVSAASYSESFKNGYPPSLAALGPHAADAQPDCHATHLIDSYIAAGRKRNYLFVYSPGPTVKNPIPGCPPGVQSYAIHARPLEFKPGRASFFTDQSGVIRFTRENRQATVDDPPIQ